MRDHVQDDDGKRQHGDRNVICVARCVVAVKGVSDNTPTGTPATLTVFLSAVIAVGIVIVGYSLSALPQTPNPVGWIALGSLALVTASFAVKVPGVPVYLSISDAFFITSALLFGPAPATVTIAIDSFVISLRRGNTARQLLFNSTSSATALWCGVETYYALSGSAPGVRALPDTSMLAPLACLAAVYFLANSGLTAVAVALSNGISIVKLWRQHFAIISLNYFAAASAAFFLIVLVHHLGVGAIAAVIPLILVCHFAMRSWTGRVEDAQRHLTRVNQLYVSTMSALSTAIEAKDGVTSAHIHRVQAYATGLARALDVKEPALLQAIEAAALLHDAGKIAIPEHILNKPGKLTPSEFETMQTHVSIGADILSVIDFPYPVVPIVRAHHENWDGSGYPNGLRGEEIPIGARILSVVDCFDALTSDRPYRPAMTEAAALEVIMERRGTMYDPFVVDTFLRVYREIHVPAPEPQLQAVMRNIRQGTTKAAAEARVSASAPAAVHTSSSEELLGFVSLARLASGSSTVRDVGALAWSQLRPLAPGATLALFAVDESKTSVVTQYVAGPAAERVTATAIPMGERITGWVAANCRTIANSDATLDMEQRVDGLRLTLSVPLMSDGGIVGVLTLYGPERFNEQLVLTVEMVAPHLARSIAFALAAETPDVAATPQAQAKKSRALSLVSRR
jgi:putative nucleotidyltransferase with HDIG domain